MFYKTESQYLLPYSLLCSVSLYSKRRRKRRNKGCRRIWEKKSRIHINQDIEISLNLKFSNLVHSIHKYAIY